MKTIVIKCPKCDQRTFEVSAYSDEALALLSDEDGLPKSVEFRKGKCKNEECGYSKDENISDLMAVFNGLGKDNIDDSESKLLLLQAYVGDTFETEFCKGYLNYLKRQYAIASENFQEAKNLYSKNLDDNVPGQANYFGFWFDFMRLLSLLHLRDNNNFISTWDEVKYRLETNNAKNKKIAEYTKVLPLFDFSLSTLKLIYEFKEMHGKDIENQFDELKKYLKTKTGLNPQLQDDYITLLVFENAPRTCSYGLMFIVLFFIKTNLIQKQFTFLLESVIDKLDGTLKTKEFEWFEQFLSIIIPIHDKPLRNDFWYWPIKFKLNELQFKHYVLQGDVDSAFKYIEDKGVDFIKQDKHGFFEIPPEDVPEPFKYTYSDWGEMHGGLEQFEDMIDAEWYRPLKEFYIPVKMYHEYLKNPLIEKTAGKEIKERILKLTKDPGHDDYYIRIMYPSFVGRIAEEMEEFDLAINFYEKSDLDRNVKLTSIENCRLQRDGIRYDELRKVLRTLDENEQRQLVAYSQIFSLERRLRKIVADAFEKTWDTAKWWGQLHISFREECEKRFEAWSSYQEVNLPKSDINMLDFATLSELEIIITDNWEKVFQKLFLYQKRFESILSLIGTIRNDIAHARLITDAQYEDLRKQLNKMNNQLKKAEAILNNF